MGVNEALQEMYKAEGVVLEKVESLNDLIPKTGQIKDELSKNKTQKDFDKAKKTWHDKLDKLDIALIKAKDAVEGWEGKIGSCDRAFGDVWNKAGEIEKSINDVEAMIKANNVILEKILYGEEEDDPLFKSLPRQIINKEDITTWKSLRERWLIVRNSYDEAHQVCGEARNRYAAAARARDDLDDKQLSANKEFNEAKFSGNGKPGKRR